MQASAESRRAGKSGTNGNLVIGTDMDRATGLKQKRDRSDKVKAV